MLRGLSHTAAIVRSNSFSRRQKGRAQTTDPTMNKGGMQDAASKPTLVAKVPRGFYSRRHACASHPPN